MSKKTSDERYRARLVERASKHWDSLKESPEVKQAQALGLPSIGWIVSESLRLARDEEIAEQNYKAGFRAAMRKESLKRKRRR